MTIHFIKELPAWRGTNRYELHFQKLPLRRQLQVLIDVTGTQNLHRSKVNASTTKRDRAYVCFQLLDQLDQAGFALKNILNIDTRHIGAVLQHWKSEGLAPASLTKRISIFRWLLASIGKAGLLRDPAQFGLLPEDLARNFVAQVDKSWESRGTIPADMIEHVKQYDKWVGAQLHLMLAFGLRVTEALLIKPRASHVGESLRIEEGTKGGRSRIVQVDTEDQRMAIETAKELSMLTRKGAMVPPGKTPQQARRRLYYVCEKFGITKAQLDITPHGLRHQYANDLYQKVSGTPSTVRGGSFILDAAREAAALHAVTSDMGHARLNITSAYLGPKKRKSKILSRTPTS